MRWSNPKNGDVRTIAKFALLPIFANGEWRWMERVTIEQKFKSDEFVCNWVNTRFIDKKPKFDDYPVVVFKQQPMRCLLLASYCGDDNKNCSEDFPCDDCLQMCNIVIINESSKLEILGGMDYLKDIKNENNP